MCQIKETITVAKIGTGTEDDMFRPDTELSWWSVLSEDETTFTIQILEVEGG